MLNIYPFLDEAFNFYFFPNMLSLVTINVNNNYLTLIMYKSTLIYFKLTKLQKNLPQIYFKLKNRNVVVINY